MRVHWMLGCLLVLAVATTAHAQPALDGAGAPGNTPPLERPEPTEPMQTESYRWQALAVDAVAAVAVLSGNNGLLGLGVVTYGLGTPLIHIAHGEGSRAVVSTVLRVGLPLAGMILLGPHLGRASCNEFEDATCDGGGDGLDGLVRGFEIGMLTAAVIDDVLVARPVQTRKPLGPGWSPQISASSHNLGLGIVGRF